LLQEELAHAALALGNTGDGGDVFMDKIFEKSLLDQEF
jgi:hypothetical protein